MSYSDRSSVYSMDGLADNILSLPDSLPDIGEPSTSVGFFDVDLLCRKLEAYKASVDEAEARLRRQKSLSPREAADVAAAARFRQQIDNYSENREARRNSEEGPADLTRSSSTNSAETSLLSPVTPNDQETVQQALKAATETHQQEIQQKKASRSAQAWATASGGRGLTITKALSRSSTRLFKGKASDDGVSYSPVKVHKNGITVDSPLSLASPNFAPTERLQLPRSTSSTMLTTTLQSGQQSPMWPPNEDQVRREIEDYAIQGEKDPRQKQDEYVDDDDDNNEDNAVATPRRAAVEDMKDSAARKTKHEYGKTTFRERWSALNILHRRTRTDKLIELYMDAAQLEEMKGPKRSKSIMLFR